MYIEVTNKDDEVIFNGNADEFLETNQYDEEIEMFLNDLDYSCRYGESKTLYGNFTDEFVVTKIEKSLYED